MQLTGDPVTALPVSSRLDGREGMPFTKLLTLYSAAGVIAVVAWVLNVGQLYWMAAALALLPQASRIVASLELRGLRITRAAPGAAHQGETVVVRIQVENLTPLPKLHVTVLDLLPQGLTAVPDFALPLHLAPRGADAVSYSLRLGRRGWHELDAVSLIGSDPLGLVHRECRHTLPARILVYPRVVPLPDQAIPTRIAGGSAPIQTSQRQGEGTSFFGIREYRPGDPLHHIHWRTAARIGKLTVVEWEAEESRDTLLAIETRESAQRDWGAGSTLDAAAGLAASLAARFLAEEHSVRIIAPGTTPHEPPARRGGAGMLPSLEELARMLPAESSLAAALRPLCPRLAPGTTICWITPALDAQLIEDCRYLLACRLLPVLYALIDEPGASTELIARLQALGVEVVALRRSDDLVRTLLS